MTIATGSFESASSSVNAVGPATPGPFVSQFATVVVKPRGGQRADSLATALRRDVQKADPNLPSTSSARRAASSTCSSRRTALSRRCSRSFGVVAVVLASVGIYGVMSFAVNQRTQEFGVRMALGASGRRILQMVVRQGVVQIAIGLVLGPGLALALAVAAADGIQNTLFGVSGRDPLIYLAVAALVAVVSLVATFVPAQRATRVDPMVALRAE